MQLVVDNFDYVLSYGNCIFSYNSWLIIHSLFWKYFYKNQLVSLKIHLL